jgi:probable rRNA maturation factor
MNIIEIENKTTEAINETEIRSTIDDALLKFKVKKSLVEVLFVSQEEIANLNKEYRKIDKPTDVLSFPQPEIGSVAIRVLGSIVINLEVVRAKEEDLIDVVRHGLLHLLGYDHEENDALWQKSADQINCKL